MLLCLFSFVSNVTGNLAENTRELAIMRTVGLQKNQIYAMIFLEALIVVLGSCFLGTAIGVVVGSTMLLQ